MTSKPIGTKDTACVHDKSLAELCEMCRLRARIARARELVVELAEEYPAECGVGMAAASAILAALDGADS